MPMIPPSKLSELVLTRRKLFEKIMQNVATRKIQNSIQATGDRMSVTPQQFGMQVGQQVKKSSFAPGGAGVPDFSMKMAGVLAAAGRGAGKALNALATGVYHTPRSVKTLAAGGAGGYYFGRQHGQQAGQEQGRNDAAKALADLIKNKMPQKKASVLSVLGGLAGGGLGGLAGGAGGGILGALGGGALGGGPGAGLGLLAGGAAGLGAGAHMGGNIGASIGAGFSKKKEKPKSDEKEEKSEEKSEDSGDEEVKESAARVLAQLQKNADLPLRNMAGHVARGVGAAAEKAGPAYGYGAKPQPMTGVAGAMQRVGDTSAKMPTAGVGVVPKMVGQNIGAMAPAVQAAGNKLVAGEKKLAPQATGGISMFGMLPGLAGNLGRNLGGK